MAPTTWVDSIGPSVIAAMANQERVDLTPELKSFLETFGDHVSSEIHRRNADNRQGRRLRQQLGDVSTIVRDELEDVKASLRPAALQEFKASQLVRDTETGLPKVLVRLPALPTMVIHVERAYAKHRKGCTYGWRTRDSDGARLTGRVRQAANYVKEYCKKRNWQLSVTDLLTTWVREALEIPLITRRECSAALEPPTDPVHSAARRARVSSADTIENGDAGITAVPLQRATSSEPSRPAHARAGLGSKKRRRPQADAGIQKPSPSSPVKKLHSSPQMSKRTSPMRKTPAGKAPKSSPLMRLTEEQMKAFRENRSAQVEVAKQKMVKDRESKGLPSPPMRPPAKPRGGRPRSAADGSGVAHSKSSKARSTSMGNSGIRKSSGGSPRMRPVTPSASAGSTREVKEPKRMPSVSAAKSEAHTGISSRGPGEAEERGETMTDSRVKDVNMKEVVAVGRGSSKEVGSRDVEVSEEEILGRGGGFESGEEEVSFSFVAPAGRSLAREGSGAVTVSREQLGRGMQEEVLGGGGGWN